MKRKLPYKWVIFALCFLMVFICLGFCSGTKSLYLKGITDSLKIDRGLYSLTDSCRYIATALLNLAFGFLFAKFGARKLIGAGFVALIISMTFYILADADSVYMFYIGGAFLGTGLAWTTTTLVGIVIPKWFSGNTGTVMGIILAANGIGQTVATIILNPLIDSETSFIAALKYGYRGAYLVTIIILACAGALIVAFFRNSPKDYVEKGDAPTAKKKRPKRSAAWVGIAEKDAYKKWYFYLAAFSIFLTGIALQAVSGVSTAHIKDLGFETNYVTTIVSIHSIAMAAAKIISGLMYDKLGLRFTVFFSQAIAAVSITLLALVTPGNNVLALSYEVLISFAMPLETVLLPIIASDMFGDKSYTKIMSLFVAINTAGYALGAPVANAIFDRIGTYVPVFYVLAGMMAFVMLSFVFILRANGKDKKAIIESSAI